MHPTNARKRRGTPRLPIVKQFLRPNTASRLRKETSPQPVAPSPDSAAVRCAPAGSAQKAGEAPLPSQPWPDLRRERTLTVKEAAYLSNKSEDTIYQWLRAGRLKGWQLGGHGCNVLVAEASLKEVLRRSMQFEK